MFTLFYCMWYVFPRHFTLLNELSSSNLHSGKLVRKLFKWFYPSMEIWRGQPVTQHLCVINITIKSLLHPLVCAGSIMELFISTAAIETLLTQDQSILKNPMCINRGRIFTTWGSIRCKCKSCEHYTTELHECHC